MENCIFCKIIDGQIPSHKIYEDDYVYAFLDINPSTKGHTLVIPKKHVIDIYDMDEETAAKTFQAIPKIANAIKKAFNPIGLNIVNNNQKPHQVVFHYHIHLIPRYEDDSFKINFFNMEPTTEELLEIKEAIINNL
jgi:histidine triad (HIT) family protein